MGAAPRSSRHRRKIPHRPASRPAASDVSMAERSTWDSADPVFEKYFVRLADIIGKGSDGTVIRGHPKKEEECHALKVVSRGAYGLESELKVLRFLATMPHDHIVRLLADFPPHGRRPQHVLAFPEADTDLARFMLRPAGRRHCRPLADALGGQIVSGIAYLHDVRLVHRDLKPANILVFFEPPGPRDTAGSIGIVLKIADFSRSRFLTVRRLRAKTAFQKVAGPMSCGVATRAYAAPEMLGEDDDCGKTAAYGFGVDVWSFGCLYFELVEKLRFVPEDSVAGCRRCIEQRLGPPPPGAVIWPPAPRATAGPLVVELEAHNSVAWHPWVAGTLVWQQEKRRGARNLQADVLNLPAGSQEKSEEDKGKIIDGASKEPEREPAASPPAAARQAGTPGVTAGAFASTPLFLPSIPVLRSKRGPCQCAGHCYQPGHRSRGGCDSASVLVGSSYCGLCGCSVPGCVRPRLRGPLCHGHRNTTAELPAVLRLARSLRRVLPSLLPKVTSLPHFVGRASRDRDLGSLVIAALVDEPAEVDCVQVRFCDEGVSNEALAEELRRQLAMAVAETSPGWQGTGRDGFDRALAGGRCSGDPAGRVRQRHFPVGRQLSWLSRSGFCCSGNARRGFVGARAVSQRLGLTTDDGDLQDHGASCTKRTAPAPSRGQERDPAVQSRGRKRAREAVSPRATAGPGQSLQVFADFRRACTEAQEAWEKVRVETSIANIGAGVEAIVDGISHPGGLVPASPGYVKKSLVCKLIFACPHALGTGDWHTVTRDDAQRWSPDEVGVLKAFAEDATAASMSLLLFDRVDWGLLVSVWGCLLKGAMALVERAGLRPEDVDAEAIAAAAEPDKSVSVAVARWLAER